MLSLLNQTTKCSSSVNSKIKRIFHLVNQCCLVLFISNLSTYTDVTLQLFPFLCVCVVCVHANLSLFLSPLFFSLTTLLLAPYGLSTIDLTKVLPVTTADAHVSCALLCLPTHQWDGRCVCVCSLLAGLDALIRLPGSCVRKTNLHVYTVHLCLSLTKC